METKQVIIARKDLKMPPGKLATQVAHASLAVVLSELDMGFHLERDYEELCMPDTLKNWLNDSFTKVVLKVNSEEELVELYERVRSVIPCALIKDSGRTVFKEPTITCLGIGPAEVALVDKLTGHLKLY